MIRGKTLLTLVLVLAALLSGCSQKNNETAAQGETALTTAPPTDEPASQNNNGSEEEGAVDKNKKLILGVVDIDDNIAEGIADELAALKLGEMVSAELVESTDEVNILCMTDEKGEEYYITTDTRGYLGIIRKGSKTGTILYAPVD